MISRDVWSCPSQRFTRLSADMKYVLYWIPQVKQNHTYLVLKQHTESLVYIAKREIVICSPGAYLWSGLNRNSHLGKDEKEKKINEKENLYLIFPSKNLLRNSPNHPLLVEMNPCSFFRRDTVQCHLPQVSNHSETAGYGTVFLPFLWYLDAKVIWAWSLSVTMTWN